jgi:hypothetical protein
MPTTEQELEPPAPKAFGQKIANPVVVPPEKMIHHNVTRVGEAFLSKMKPPFS